MGPGEVFPWPSVLSQAPVMDNGNNYGLTCLRAVSSDLPATWVPPGAYLSQQIGGLVGHVW